MTGTSVLPAIDAGLNAVAAICLSVGYVMVRAGRIRAHRAAMLSAFSASTAFLGCYLYYHITHDAVRFRGTGVVRWVYLSVLVSHVILAVVVVPTALATLLLAWAGRTALHRRVARWTLPLWLYVSVTGVFVYFMLYHFDPASGP